MKNGRITVLHFSNEPAARGGAEEHMLMLVRALRRDCFNAVLAGPPALLEKFGTDIPADVAVEPIEFHGVHNLRAAVQFARILHRHDVDILHSHMFHSSMAASPVGRLVRVPVILETPHVREVWRTGLKANYIVDRIIGRCVDRFIAVSHANARYLNEEKGLPADKISVIQNGVQLDRCRASGSAGWDIRQRIGATSESRIILVLARLEPQKGHCVLIHALPMVLQQYPDVRVIFLGDGSLRSELEQLVRAANLASAVYFAGYQTNVGDWITSSDFSVLPSFYEGLPLAAIESLSAAKPVVATAVDGTTEVVIDEVTGLTVPVRDSQSLASAICRLLQNPQWAAALGVAGQQLVRDQFSHDRQVRDTENLYIQALKSKRGATATIAPASASTVNVGRM